MAYEEPANPLTGKGRRHTLSALSVMGLSKAIIVEPEIEREELSYNINENIEIVGRIAKDIASITGSEVENINLRNKQTEIFVTFYKEGLKIGGEHDIDANDSKQEAALFSLTDAYMSKEYTHPAVKYTHVNMEKGKWGLAFPLKKEEKIPAGILLERVLSGGLVWKKENDKKDYISWIAPFIPEEPEKLRFNIVANKNASTLNHWHVKYEIEWLKADGWRNAIYLQGENVSAKKSDAEHTIETYKARASKKDYLLVPGANDKFEIEKILKGEDKVELDWKKIITSMGDELWQAQIAKNVFLNVSKQKVEQKGGSVYWRIRYEIEWIRTKTNGRHYAEFITISDKIDNEGKADYQLEMTKLKASKTDYRRIKVKDTVDEIDELIKEV